MVFLLQTQVQANSASFSSALTAEKLERQIFDNFVYAKQIDDGMTRANALISLKEKIGANKFDNFCSVLYGGVVGNKFFTSNWESFRSLVKMVDNAMERPADRSGTIFTFNKVEDARIFQTALSQMKCIKITQVDRAQIETAAIGLEDTAVPVIFTYNKPAASDIQSASVAQSAAPATPATAFNAPQNGIKQSPTYGATTNRNITSGAGAAQADRAQSAASTEFDEKNLFNSKPFDVRSESGQQTVYAGRFNPDDIFSHETVVLLSHEWLVPFLAERGMSIESLSGLTLNDKINLIKQMELEGSATLESPLQWRENRELAAWRGRMLGEAILRIVFEKELSELSTAKEKNDFIEIQLRNFNNGTGFVSRVVSPWYTPELGAQDPLITQESANKTLASFIQNLKNEGDLEDGLNFKNSQFIPALLTGDYASARTLISNSLLPASDQKELSQFVARVERAAKETGGAPAVTESNGIFSISNPALARKFWLKQTEGGIGLRYEIAQETTTVKGRKLSIGDLATAKKRAGAWFVSALERDYSRSARVLSSSQGMLDIKLEDYFLVSNPNNRLKYSATAEFIPNMKYSATVSVGYKIGAQNADFTDGNIIPYLNNTADQCTIEPRGKRSDGRYEFRISFTAPADETKPLTISVTANKPVGASHIDSGFVSAPIKPVKKVERVVIHPPDDEGMVPNRNVQPRTNDMGVLPFHTAEKVEQFNITDKLSNFTSFFGSNGKSLRDDFISCLDPKKPDYVKAANIVRGLSDDCKSLWSGSLIKEVNGKTLDDALDYLANGDLTNFMKCFADGATIREVLRVISVEVEELPMKVLREGINAGVGLNYYFPLGGTPKPWQPFSLGIRFKYDMVSTEVELPSTTLKSKDNIGTVSLTGVFTAPFGTLFDIGASNIKNRDRTPNTNQFEAGLSKTFMLNPKLSLYGRAGLGLDAVSGGKKSTIKDLTSTVEARFFYTPSERHRFGVGIKSAPETLPTNLELKMPRVFALDLSHTYTHPESGIQISPMVGIPLGGRDKGVSASISLGIPIGSRLYLTPSFGWDRRRR